VPERSSSDASAGYRAPVSEVSAEVRDRGSRFLAIVLPCASDEESARWRVELERRFPDATHCCWAQRLGDPPRERASDAGEPAGTAGAPILRVLRGASLSDVLAVVARWFGGTKLGKGGLARAYAAAARAAVAELRTVVRLPTVELVVVLSHARLGVVKRLLRPPEVELVSESYGVEVTLRLRVAKSRLPGVEAALAEAGVMTFRPEAP